MSRYYFDLHDDMDALDDEGHELADADAAKAVALCEARTMIQVSVGETGRIDLRHRIDVRDESGSVIHLLHFEDAVAIQRGNQMVSQPGAVAA